MRRPGQLLAAIGILLVSLALTAFGAMSGRASTPAPVAVDAAVTLARLDDFEPALARLLESARAHEAAGDPVSYETLEGALARFAEVRALVDGLRARADEREKGQLLDASRALARRVHLLALEIAHDATPEKLALLDRLAHKAHVALDQLREADTAPRRLSP